MLRPLRSHIEPRSGRDLAADNDFIEAQTQNMDNSPARGPLTDDELDRLGDFLGAIGTPAMNLESLDGYFAALICGPDMVLPNEYLSEVWGEDFSFDSDRQSSDILDLLMRHWNTIASALLHTLEVPDVYLPVLIEDAEGVAHGNDWAHGFMRGVHGRSGWRELMDSDEYGGPLLPIMLLAHEHDPDPAMRPKPVAPENREELLETIIAGLTSIYRYFEPHRRSGLQAQREDAHTPLRRRGPKVGRNDSCPCGSGKKYKLCCAANVPTVH